MKTYEVKCKGCGKKFLAGHPLALKCPNCKVVAAREKAKKRIAAWRALQPKSERALQPTKCATFGCKAKPHSLGLCEKCYRRDLRRRKSTNTNVKASTNADQIIADMMKGSTP